MLAFVLPFAGFCAPALAVMDDGHAQNEMISVSRHAHTDSHTHTDSATLTSEEPPTSGTPVCCFTHPQIAEANLVSDKFFTTQPNCLAVAIPTEPKLTSLALVQNRNFSGVSPPNFGTNFLCRSVVKKE